LNKGRRIKYWEVVRVAGIAGNQGITVENGRIQYGGHRTPRSITLHKSLAVLQPIYWRKIRCPMNGIRIGILCRHGSKYLLGISLGYVCI
jgi:hypothetical protein